MFSFRTPIISQSLALSVALGAITLVGWNDAYAEFPTRSASSLTARSGADASPRASQKKRFRYVLRFHTVRRGETLGSIASKRKVKISQLRRWNNLERGEFIRVGQRLKYTLRLERTAKTTTAQRKRSKPTPKAKLPPKRAEQPPQLKVPAKVVKPSVRPRPAPINRRLARPNPSRAGSSRPWIITGRQKIATSIGKANNGRLINGVALPRRGPGFRRIHSRRFYGTDKTIALLMHVGKKLAARFPGTEPVLIGSIANKDGGPAGRHKSHQNGLDVDIAFLEKGNPKRRHYRGRVKPHELDYVKNWFLIETMVLTGEVNYIFINRPILIGLRKQARKVGWSEKDLKRLFGNEDLKGRGRILRHWPGHGYHMHVRFKCPRTDKQCKNRR